VTLSGQGEERAAQIVVPDGRLSLAIRKKGQNAGSPPSSRGSGGREEQGPSWPTSAAAGG
jgi:hypothetical protein